MRLLAITGSLRTGSSNRALLEATRALAPPGVEVTLYESLGALPHFNADLETGALPPLVADLRERIGLADGVLISSPEYAHGVPGVLKNALDWLVGSVEFPDKPVALIHASSRGCYAQASLIEILTTMKARLIHEASVTVPLLGRTLGGPRSPGSCAPS
jgi:NAD(P)H-dependent FMN reductase